MALYIGEKPREPRRKDVYKRGAPKTGGWVTYCRVSTAGQGRSGLGLEAQRKAIQTYLNGGDWQIIKEFVEVESAGDKKERPILKQAIDLCKKHKATLLVAKLDRLSRDVEFTAALLKSSVKFVCADMGTVNNFSIHIFAAHAEETRRLISERSKETAEEINRYIKKQGFYDTKEKTDRNGNVVKKSQRIYRLGNPDPKGATKAGREVRTKKAMQNAENIYAVIERIRSFGVTSLRGIAEELMFRKIKTPLGRDVWHPQQVKLCIQRIENEKK